MSRLYSRYDKLLTVNREQLVKMALFFILVLFAWNWANHVLPHQIVNAPIFNISIDNTFWLFHLSGIPSWFIKQQGVLFMLELVFLITGAIVFFSGSHKLSILFLAAGIILSLLQQTYTCTLTKIEVTFLIVMLPFCFSRRLFAFTWKLPRYYLVYLMVSAGLFKLINGGALDPVYAYNYLANQHTDILVYNSSHISGTITGFFQSNKALSYAGYLFVTLVELSFIGLLFTKRFDMVYILLLILLCATIYFVMRINSAEILLLVLPLLKLIPSNYDT